MDLLNSSCAGTLDGYSGALSGKEFFVLQLFHRDPLRRIDQPSDIEKVSILIDFWNTAMISDEVIFISCDSRFD